MNYAIGQKKINKKLNNADDGIKIKITGKN